MISYSSLFQIRQAITHDKLSCKGLVSYYLDNIRQKSHLNAFLEVYEEDALNQAEKIDEKFKSGTQGRLAGMVVGIKDVFCYKDHPLQCSSKILDGFYSQFTATAVQRLLDEDAIIIGRQNCDEFAMGSSTENSAFGVTRNAANPDRVPGGSSGGSAVAVQADMCLVSIGSDTGGSVRQPAAFCGIIGMKPTYSRISRYGLTAYASSFDCVGILSKSVEDTALVLEIISGADEFDSTVSQKEVTSYSQTLDFSGKAKIAYLSETIDSPGLNPVVREKTLQKLEWLKSQGHTVEAVDFPLLKYILPVYYILTTAEASSNLARYDGVRYGFRSENTKDLESLYKKTRNEGFGAEVKRRIMLGTFVLSADYYDAYYTKAQKIRRLIKEGTERIFSNYDFIVSPATPNTAFEIGAHKEDPLEMYLEDIFTVQANVAGIPAISIPNGQGADGMPIGFQIMSDFFKEDKLLAFSQYLLGSV